MPANKLVVEQGAVAYEVEQGHEFLSWALTTLLAFQHNRWYSALITNRVFKKLN